jgi:alpha-L-rhamnosidase
MKTGQDDFTWQALWIGRDAVMVDWRGEVLPAPLFRNEFTVSSPVIKAELRICGLGYYELSVNGNKVGDHVLDPIVTQYDKRVRYVTYDVADQLTVGTNAVGIVLGNGWYNCHTPDVWHFDRADWRDYPKLLLQLDILLENGDAVTICSGPDWQVGDGPIRFDGLRNGEIYDAREERLGWDMPGYRNEQFKCASVVLPPGGILEEQISPPCKVMTTISPVAVKEIKPGIVVYDFGQNIAGWIQLRVEGGTAGAEIVMRYAECIKDNGEIDQSNISKCVKSDVFQTDKYIMSGADAEVWSPRFTYHGFQYVQIEGMPGTPGLDNVAAEIIYISFDQIGSFECSNEDLNNLQECTLRSYVGNFVGIPTDCPHREKNGWTGDALIATETGLMNFDVASSYAQWLDSMADTQRPNGQFPGVVPSAGWGYNWGSGPAWDSAFILIPWYIYLYMGDISVIEKHYDGMKRYVDFCTGMAIDNIVSFGLGDWCPPDGCGMPPIALTSTGYYYADAKLLAIFARLLGKKDDADKYGRLSENIKRAFNAEFYKGNGVYAEGRVTALSCALYHGLVEDGERDMVVRQLVDKVTENKFKATFGILGAKYTPRVLADNGHAGLAYKIISQPEFPGWVNWLRIGSTTLRENWDSSDSQNHIMFGDVSAWMYNYLGGIRPDPDNPGFKNVIIQPCFIDDLDMVRVSYRSRYGIISLFWKRSGNGVELEIEIPQGVTADLILPEREPERITGGTVPVSVSPRH